MKEDTVATEGWTVLLRPIAVAAAELLGAGQVIPNRKGILIKPHATETIFVGHSLTTCDFPIAPGDAPFGPALGSNIKVFARATGAIANHPVVQIA